MMLLQKGSINPAVKFLREMMWDYGCVGPDSSFWISSEVVAAGIAGPEDPKAKSFWVDNEVFDWYLKKVVQYFQSTHESVLKPGVPLDPDGVVGKETWAAIEAGAKGTEPKQGISLVAKPITPDMPMGDKIVYAWTPYIGEKEKPKGSNRSAIIDKFTRFTGRPKGVKGPAWCDASASFIENAALGNYPLNYLWRCYDTMQFAKKRGLWISIEDVRSGKRDIRVGQRWIMQYGGGRGHTGHVAFVVRDSKGRAIKFYTREGNYRDTVGITLRGVDQPSLAGFCDFLPLDDQSVGEKGRNLHAIEAGGKTT